MSENNEAPKGWDKIDTSTETSVPSGTATEADVERMLTNPAEFGIEWKAEPIASVKDKAGVLLAGGKKLVLRTDAPRPYVAPENVETFRIAFGDAIVAKAINGTSVDVAAEDVLRRELLGKWHEQRARAVSNDDLKRAIIRSVLLGQRSARSGGTRKVWIVDGVAYATEAEAMAASKPRPTSYKSLRPSTTFPTLLEAKQDSVLYLTEQGFTVELAQKAVAGMTE